MSEIEKNLSKKVFLDKLKRLIKNLEKNKAFTIQVSGKKISVPSDAGLRIEFEKDGRKGELEFELRW